MRLRIFTLHCGLRSGTSLYHKYFRRFSAGFLLSFTFSFNEFIIAFFVAGSETTLPIYVFSSIRRWVTPEVNAIGTYGANSISGFAWHTVSPSLSRRARFEKSTLRDCARNLDSSHYMWKTLAGLSVLLGSCFRDCAKNQYSSFLTPLAPLVRGELSGKSP